MSAPKTKGSGQPPRQHGESGDQDEAIAALAEKLTGSKPRDLALYRRALTHGSLQSGEDYQRLEFLGDRVLGLTIAEWLYCDKDSADEGELSQSFNRLVSGESCARVARDNGLGDHLRLGKQASDDGARSSSNILGDVIEALIGACFIDQGFDAARAMVLRLWLPLLGDAGQAAKHPKSALQEWCAGSQRAAPEYSLVRRSGPDHAAKFCVAVSVRNVGEVEAEGSSKQEAETAAAKEFLTRYG